MLGIESFIPVRPNLEILEPMMCKVFNLEALELTTCGMLEQTFFISHAASLQTVDYVSHVGITR